MAIIYLKLFKFYIYLINFLFNAVDSTSLSQVLLRWICAQLHAYEFTKELKDVSDVFSNGLVLCALINRYGY